MTETDATVVVDNVHVHYRTWTRGRAGVQRQVDIHALRGVSFVARRGETIGVIGHNGAGKSTLMQVIAGLLPPSDGAVYARSRPVLLGIGSALIPALSGAQNVELGCLAMGLSRAEAQERYAAIVEFSGIGDAIDMPMRTYSAGMAARLKFAIASAVTHEILLIDEALSAGDADFKRRSTERIEELRTHAHAVFIVSHSMSAIRRTATRVLWIDRGELRADGDPESVVDRYLRATARRNTRVREARTKEPTS